MCISVFIYINKTVYPRTSDCKLYYIIPVMTLVSDGLVSPYILIWASFFFLFMDGTELERKEARVLWSNSDLFCFPKRNSVYGRVFGKWEVDFFFFEGLLLRSNLLRVGPCSWLGSHIYHWPLSWKTQMANYAVTSCWTVNGMQKQKLLSQQPSKCWGTIGVKWSLSRN